MALLQVRAFSAAKLDLLPGSDNNQGEDGAYSGFSQAVGHKDARRNGQWNSTENDQQAKDQE